MKNVNNIVTTNLNKTSLFDRITIYNVNANFINQLYNY